MGSADYQDEHQEAKVTDMMRMGATTWPDIGLFHDAP